MQGRKDGARTEPRPLELQSPDSFPPDETAGGFKRWENLAGGRGVVWPSGMTRSREAEVSKALWLQ